MSQFKKVLKKVSVVTGSLLLVQSALAMEPQETTVTDIVAESIEYATVTVPEVYGVTYADKVLTPIDQTKTDTVSGSTTNIGGSDDRDDDDDRSETNSYPDPWEDIDPVYGEFGNPVDLQVHYSAMGAAQSAATQCGQLCAASSNMTPAQQAARQAVINSVYSQKIDDEYRAAGVPASEQSIPAGPMEARAKYIHNRAPTPQEEQIDFYVVNGLMSYYNPGQAPFRSSGTAIQMLGQQESLVLVAPDRETIDDFLLYTGNEGVDPAFSLGGLSLLQEGINGGIILINNEGTGVSPLSVGQYYPVSVLNPNKQGDTLQHEYHHAGEQAIYNIVDQRVASGKPVSQTLITGADTAWAVRVGGRSVEAGDFPSAELILGTGNVPGMDHYSSMYTEIFAYGTEKTTDAESLGGLANQLKDEFGLTEEEALRVVEDIVAEDSVVFQAYQEMEKAAAELLGVSQ